MNAYEKAVAGRTKECAAGVERWYYLSFATDERFLGALVLKAFGKSDVVLMSHELKLNPGGSVMILEMADEFPDPPPEFTNRLLNKADLDELDKHVPPRPARVYT